ncbi:hypothetical protein PHLCEN_2v8894 [Hermanssonia centrifuga]|uniref:Uncharacterized protein n=1 Tax=Hermanssonia centrifuga TaxID=98765 RepID=A0A2R6NSC4_9APHY|nr:hypothetical protein PHLCEN_2v8894 [Hermanssonia centrifuga]
MLVHKQKTTQAQIQKCGTKSPAYERYEKRGRQTHSFERHKVGDWVLTKLLMTPKETKGRPSNTVHQIKSRQILCNGVYSGRGKCRERQQVLQGEQGRQEHGRNDSEKDALHDLEDKVGDYTEYGGVR